MQLSQGEERAWPPAFSQAFVEATQAVLDLTGHVTIVGPLGSSRGLLASLITGAPESGTVWWRSDASTVRPKAPYTAINQIIPALAAEPSEPTGDVKHRALATLTAAHDRPCLILREADLSDTQSVEVLFELAEAGHIRLVTTAGAEFAAHVPSSAEVVRLAPLESSVITYLVEERFGAQAHPTTVAMLAARSQGAYGALREIADLEFAARRIEIVAGVLVPTHGLDHDVPEAVVPSRLARNGPTDDAHELVEVAALVHELVEREAIAAFGASAVSSAMRSGIVRRDGDLLVFASHAEARLVQRTMTIERRTAIHRCFGDRLRESCWRPSVASHVTTWLMSIDQPISADLAARAALQANREGRHTHALRFVAAIRPDERSAQLITEQGHALMELGALEALAEAVKAVDLTTVPNQYLVPLCFWTRVSLSRQDAADRFDRVRASAAGDRDRLGAVELTELMASVHDSGSDSIGRQLKSIATSDHLSRANRAVALTLCATWSRQAARADDAVAYAHEAVELLESTPDAASWICEWSLEVAVLAHVAAADLHGARIALDRYSARGAAHGNFGRLGMAMWGMHSFFSGNIRGALANFAVALSTMPATDPHQIRAWCEGMFAQAVAQTGEVEQVEALLASARSRPPGRALQYELERRLAEACACDSIGDPESALSTLQSVIDTAREHDLHLEEVDAAVLSVQIGGPGYNWLLLRATKDLQKQSGTSMIWKRFAEAIGDNQMNGLVALAVELDREGAYVFAAEVARFTLEIARRASDMTEQERDRLAHIADPMAHRQVSRPD